MYGCSCYFILDIIKKRAVEQTNSSPFSLPCFHITRSNVIYLELTQLDAVQGASEKRPSHTSQYGEGGLGPARAGGAKQRRNAPNA